MMYGGQAYGKNTYGGMSSVSAAVATVFKAIPKILKTVSNKAPKILKTIKDKMFEKH